MCTYMCFYSYVVMYMLYRLIVIMVCCIYDMLSLEEEIKRINQAYVFAMHNFIFSGYAQPSLFHIGEQSGMLFY